MDAPPLPPTGPDLTGRRLGDYQITRLLGQGGMATVYQATQNSLNRDVAFKVLKPELAAKNEHVARFLDEARNAARVVHPNIVQIYDMGELDGLHFIAQELVTGANLKQVLKRDRQLPVAMTVNVVRQVALALHKAAEAQVIHRDIKPENILLSASGEVKVADFGLARAALDPDAVRKTRPGMVMGTPLYMSPEQIEDNEVDHRSDLYSLGVTCYHLLAGKPPFEGDTPLSIALQHLQAVPKPLPILRDDVSDGLWRVVNKLMEKAPERRYQDAVELLRDLRNLAPNGDNTDDWAVQELVSLTEARTQASQQLQKVMSLEQHRRRAGLYSGIVLIVGLVLAIPLGIAAAYITRDQPLLNSRARPAAAEALPTIQEQYTHAVVVGTDEAIRAVWLHHEPGNSAEEFLVNKAKRRLAQSLAAQNCLDEAKPLFDELASLPDTETEFRVFGQLGQAMILWHDDRQEDAAVRINATLRGLSQLTQFQRQVVLRTLEPKLKERVVERLEDFRPGKKKSDVRDST